MVVSQVCYREQERTHAKAEYPDKENHPPPFVSVHDDWVPEGGNHLFFILNLSQNLIALLMLM